MYMYLFKSDNKAHNNTHPHTHTSTHKTQKIQATQNLTIIYRTYETILFVPFIHIRRPKKLALQLCKTVLKLGKPRLNKICVTLPRRLKPKKVLIHLL